MTIQEKNQEAKEWSVVISLHRSLVFLITSILVLFAGYREIGLDKDSLGYARNIQSIDFSSLSNLDFLDKEPSFYFIVYVAHWLFSDAIRGTFVIYALFGVTLKILGIYRLSYMPIFSIILYATNFYILHELTQIRVGVASAIFLLAIPDLVNRNYRAYFIKAIFAILFHYSALIMLILYPIVDPKRNMYFYYIIPLFGLFLAFMSKSIMNFIMTNISLLDFVPSIISHKLIIYIDLYSKGIFTEINIFGIYTLSLVIIYYFSLINLRRFKLNKDIVLIKILGLSIFAYYAFSFLPVYAFRVAYFLQVVVIILLPSIVYIFKQKKVIILYILIYFLIYCVHLVFIQRLLQWSG